MPKFDIYVKVSILINYKTKQPSNLAWNISLTSWLCDIGVCFFICLSVRSSVRLSTFMSKFNVYVKVSILINYKTKQPSKPCMKHLPDLLTLRHRHPLFCPSVCPFVSTFMSKFDIYVKVSILINYNSTTTIIPCMTHLPDLLTWQIHWPGDHDLYFALQWLGTIYVDVPDLLNYKAYNYQTLNSASPRCTDSAGVLTGDLLHLLRRPSICPQLEGLQLPNLV